MKATTILGAVSFAALTALANIGTLPAMAADAPLAGIEQTGVVHTHVLAIDAANRKVTLADADGKPMVVQLSDQATNLQNLAVGDLVTIRFSRTVVTDLLKSSQGKLSKHMDETITHMPEGKEMPGVNALRQTTMVGRITSIDLKDHEVTVTGPSGKVHVFGIQDPALRRKLKTLKTGELVQFIYTESVAITTSKP
ncbi:MAG: hypothetical protein PW790_11800 [Parvibaculaceae bacterium]|nr:hypothetical protein [Parvibaculaceae bacterium]